MHLVLVVDDDRDALDLYCYILEEMGLAVVCALDGLEALRLADELRPDLVLTDWRMPRMDGIELCKALRRDVLLGDILLILHSSEVIPEPWQADVCLRKPSSPEHLQRAVKGLLERRKNTAAQHLRGYAVEEACTPAF